jgi:hypothetical protein
VLEGSTIASYGPMHEMVRARFSGPAIYLRTRTKSLTIGPNHPMLARGGFIKANEIRKDDELLYDARVDWPAMSSSYLEQMPMVQDVFVASLLLGSRSRAASHLDLYGDAVSCEGKVEIVNPARDLLTVLDPCGIEQFSELTFPLTDADLQFISSLRSCETNLDVIPLSTSSRVSSGDLRGSISFVHTAPFDTLLFGRRAEFDAILCEQQSNRAALNIIRGCKPDDGVAITISGDNIPHVVGAYLGDGLIPEPSATDLLCASSALCHSGVSDLHAIGHRPQSDTALEEDRSDSVWTRAKLVGERFEADAGDVVIDEPVSIDRLRVAFRQPTNCNTVLKQNLFSEPRI